MKKLVFLLTVLFAVLLPVTSFAAPDSVDPNDGGNTNGLIIIKKPENAESTTTKQNYTISALSLEGVEVALYRYNAASGRFEIMRDASGNPMTSYVGASGIYFKEINLHEGTNYIMIGAWYGGYYQTVRLDIVLLNQGLLNDIKGFAANFQSIFGW